MPVLDDKRLDEAPDWVRNQGGVFLSLWMFGAGETDLEIVREWRDDKERLRDELRGWVRHTHTKRSRHDPPVAGCPRCNLETEGLI